jgi:IS30 family transposase
MPLYDERFFEMKRLYLDEGLTLREVGERMGVTRQAVHFRLKRAGVMMRGNYTHSQTFERELLYRLYVTEGHSTGEVAAKLGVTAHHVTKQLVRNAIERRHGGQRVFVDRDVLHRLYVVDGLTQRQVAVKLGVSHSTIEKELKRHEIHFRHTPKRLSFTLDRDLLHCLYIDEHRTSDEIAATLGICKSTVHNYLRRYGIEIRNGGGKQPHPFDRDLLLKLYVTEGLTLAGVAAKLGVTSTMINNALKRNNIKRRPKGRKAGR